MPASRLHAAPVPFDAGCTALGPAKSGGDDGRDGEECGDDEGEGDPSGHGLLDRDGEAGGSASLRVR